MNSDTRKRPMGLDQQGRFPQAVRDDDIELKIGLGAFLPGFLAIVLVGACAALVLLIKDFT